MRRLLAMIPECVLNYTSAIGVALFIGYGFGQLSTVAWWCR